MDATEIIGDNNQSEAANQPTNGCPTTVIIEWNFEFSFINELILASVMRFPST